jgi:ABC-type Zn uptake system ZnuABC Zn-binding protein ZnuA
MFYKIKVLSTIVLGLMVLLLVACGAQSASQTAQQPVVQTGAALETQQVSGEKPGEAEHDKTAEEHAGDEHGAAAEGMVIADLAPVDLTAGEKLTVLATTNIIGDMAHNVTGDLIDLTVMIPVGSDPHGFSPTPQDVATVAETDMVLSNGLGYEEFLSEVIENAGGEAIIIATSTGVETRDFEATADHDEADQEHASDEHAQAHEDVDPHLWMTPANAQVMVRNIAAALSALDPTNAAAYEANATAYEARLKDLDAWVQEQIATIPIENRQMVTDHEAFGYYADRYGLKVVGAVIPAYSTNVEPSAQELADLQDKISMLGVKAIFVNTTINPTLAKQVAADSGIRLVPLYAESLGEVGSGVETYIDFIRYNTTAIVEALR